MVTGQDDRTPRDWGPGHREPWHEQRWLTVTINIRGKVQNRGEDYLFFFCCPDCLRVSMDDIAIVHHYALLGIVAEDSEGWTLEQEAAWLHGEYPELHLMPEGGSR